MQPSRIFSTLTDSELSHDDMRHIRTSLGLPVEAQLPGNIDPRPLSGTIPPEKTTSNSSNEFRSVIVARCSQMEPHDLVLHVANLTEKMETLKRQHDLVQAEQKTERKKSRRLREQLDSTDAAHAGLVALTNYRPKKKEMSLDLVPTTSLSYGRTGTSVPRHS